MMCSCCIAVCGFNRVCNSVLVSGDECEVVSSGVEVSFSYGGRCVEDGGRGGGRLGHFPISCCVSLCVHRSPR